MECALYVIQYAVIPLQQLFCSGLRDDCSMLMRDCGRIMDQNVSTPCSTH